MVSKSKAVKVKWTEDVSDEDYRAAELYLSIIYTSSNVSEAAEALKAAPIEKFRATGLLRASQMKLPKFDDRPGKLEIKKIDKGEALSPVLLVRDASQKKVIIADGFHRIGAAYRIAPDVILHCKIV